MNLSWEMLYPIGALILFAGLIYGMIQYRSRNRSNDRITDAATRAQYDDPENYPAKREALKKELRPS